MHKIWAVIRREFIEKVRTRAFILATVLGPLFFGVLAIVPGYLMSRDTGVKRVLDTGGRGDQLQVRPGTCKLLRQRPQPPIVSSGDTVLEESG